MVAVTLNGSEALGGCETGGLIDELDDEDSLAVGLAVLSLSSDACTKSTVATAMSDRITIKNKMEPIIIIFLLKNGGGFLFPFSLFPVGLSWSWLLS
eukprot:Awhi_evm1s15017